MPIPIVHNNPVCTATTNYNSNIPNVVSFCNMNTPTQLTTTTTSTTGIMNMSAACMKRSRDNIEISSSILNSFPPSKRVCTDMWPLECGKLNATELNNAFTVASSLLSLKKSSSTIKSPMVQWTKLFHQDDDDSDTDSTSTESEHENKLVSALAHAALSKKKSPNVMKIVSTPIPVKPDAFLKGLLESKGKSVEYVSASSLNSFFVNPEPSFVEGYTKELVQAVRNDDVETLRTMHENGKVIFAGTKFGDSVIHLACRRKCVKVVEFFIKEMELSCRIACDLSRTILHDSFWVPKPNYKIIEIVLNACPDLLYIKDQRGFTPLEYLPKEHWHSTCTFLQNFGVERLLPKDIPQLKN